MVKFSSYQIATQFPGTTERNQGLRCKYFHNFLIHIKKVQISVDNLVDIFQTRMISYYQWYAIVLSFLVDDILENVTFVIFFSITLLG